MMPEQSPAGFRRHRFLEQSIDLPADLNEVQLDGRVCIRCGHAPEIGQSTRPAKAWGEQSAQLFECDDLEAWATRRGLCLVRGHEWRWHTTGGMCQGTGDGVECHCVMIRPAA
jgi:hypothetical protein